MGKQLRLIPAWRSAWRLYSVRIAAVATVFGLLPPDQQSAILAWIGLAPERIPAVIGGLFIAGRLLQQPDQKE